MSVSGYFERPRPEGLARLREIVEELGGRVERKTEYGNKTVEDWHAEFAAGPVKNPTSYVDVDKYDPVLRAHCRL